MATTKSIRIHSASGRLYTESADFAEITGQALTIEFWCKSAVASSGNNVVSKGDRGNQGYYLVLASGDKLQLLTNNSGSWASGPVSTSNFNVAAWHHWAAVKSATGMLIYRDGVLEGSNSAGAGQSIGTNARRFELGFAFPSTAGPTGYFSEVRLWNVARTGPEIAGSMYDQLAGTETGLIGYWPMTEGSGTTTESLPAGHPLTLADAVWEADAPPVTESGGGNGGGGDCATPEDLDNALASWLSSSDVTHPDSLPLENQTTLVAVDGKVDGLAAEVDFTFGPWRAWIEGKFGEISIGIAKIDDQTAPPAGQPVVPNNQVLAEILTAIAASLTATTAQHEDHDGHLTEHDGTQTDQLQRVARVLSGHPEYDLTDVELPAWSITGDVNAHTDEALVLLQGDLNDHEASTVAAINAHTSAESTRVEGAINGHADAIALAQAAADLAQTSTITDHVTAEADRVNLHTTAETDAVVNTVNIHADANTAALSVAIVASEERLADQATSNRAAINTHTTSEADRVIASMPDMPDSEADRIISEVNAETNRVGNEIIDSNDAQTTILIAVQSAIGLLGIAVNQVLDRLQDMVTQLTNMTGMLTQILALLQGPVPPPLTSVKVGETTFLNSVYWPVAADYYEIEIDVAGPKVGERPIPGGIHYRYMGWTAQRVGGKYTFGEPLAFDSQRVNASGILPDGLLINVVQNTSGRVSAFRYQ